MNKWELYEKQKRKLQALALSPAEYEREIQLICEGLEL